MAEIARLFAALLFALLFSQALAARDRSLQIAYSPHPEVVQRYLPLLRQVYSDLNIRSQFIKTGNGGGINSIEQGRYDADVARHIFREPDFRHALLVSPPLTEAKVYLFCRLTLPCNRDILNQSVTILATSMQLNYLKRRGNQGINAHFVQMANETRSLELLENGHANYAMIEVEKNALTKAMRHDFNHVVLYDFNVYHIISDKHKHLLPRLSRALTARLNEKAP